MVVSVKSVGAAASRSPSQSQRGVRCSLLRPDPAQRGRLAEIRDNLLDRIAEAEREGWLGELEGLRVSLAGAESKIAQIDSASRRGPVNLGLPTQRPATHE